MNHEDDPVLVKFIFDFSYSSSLHGLVQVQYWWFEIFEICRSVTLVLPD